MTAQEITFLQERLTELLVFINGAKIESEQQDAKIIDFQSRLKLLKPEATESVKFAEFHREDSPKNHTFTSNALADGGNQQLPTQCNVDLQPNIEKAENGISLKQKLKELNTDMFRLTDCVTRRKGNGFECRFRKLGFEKSKSGKTKKEAHAKMQLYLNALNKELFGICEDLKVNKKIKIKTFIDIADFFIYNVKKDMLAELSFRTLENRYRLYVRERYQNCTFAELTPMRLQKDLQAIKEKHSRTYEDVRSILNGIFKYAKANGIIGHNPIDAVYITKHYRENCRAITYAEEAKLLQAELPESVKLAIVYALYAGARSTEVSQTVVDFQTEKILIKNAKLKQHQRRNKDKLYRTLPLMPMLKPYRELIESKPALIGVKRINFHIQTVLPDVTLRNLRHTFASRAKECGVNPELVNVWQGHVAGNDITAKVYTHYSEEYEKRQALLVDYALEKIPENPR